MLGGNNKPNRSDKGRMDINRSKDKGKAEAKAEVTCFKCKMKG